MMKDREYTRKRELGLFASLAAAKKEESVQLAELRKAKGVVDDFIWFYSEVSVKSHKIIEIIDLFTGQSNYPRLSVMSGYLSGEITQKRGCVLALYTQMHDIQGRHEAEHFRGLKSPRPQSPPQCTQSQPEDAPQTFTDRHKNTRYPHEQFAPSQPQSTQQPQDTPQKKKKKKDKKNKHKEKGKGRKEKAQGAADMKYVHRTPTQYGLRCPESVKENSEKSLSYAEQFAYSPRQVKRTRKRSYTTPAGNAKKHKTMAGNSRLSKRSRPTVKQEGHARSVKHMKRVIDLTEDKCTAIKSIDDPRLKEQVSSTSVNLLQIQKKKRDLTLQLLEGISLSEARLIADVFLGRMELQEAGAETDAAMSVFRQVFKMTVLIMFIYV